MRECQKAWKFLSLQRTDNDKNELWEESVTTKKTSKG